MSIEGYAQLIEGGTRGCDHEVNDMFSTVARPPQSAPSEFFTGHSYWVGHSYRIETTKTKSHTIYKFDAFQMLPAWSNRIRFFFSLFFPFFSLSFLLLSSENSSMPPPTEFKWTEGQMFGTQVPSPPGIKFEDTKTYWPLIILGFLLLSTGTFN